MQQRYNFKDISIWVEEPADLQPALQGNQNADVVVIGGGFSGLSSALELKRRGVDVALIEMKFCGSGASGRNAGHIAPTIGKDFPSLITMFGKEYAKELIHFSEYSVEHGVKMMDDHDINCDYVAGGNIIASMHSSQEAKVEKIAKAAEELGGHVEYLDQNHMRQHGLPRAFSTGLWEKMGGILHPGKYVLGLRQAALNAGVRIYENSLMERLEEGGKPVVHTANGQITADHVVQTTNAYTNDTGRLKRKVLPMRVTLFETEPLTEEQRARIGWQGKQGIYSAHETLENYRLTEYGTLHGGSKFVRTRFGGKLADAYHEPTFIKMEQMFRDRFPELKDVKIATWWGGWIGLTPNFLPKIGSHKRHANIHHAIGYNGHGVAHAVLSGQLIADRVMGRDNQYGALFEKPGLSWPPEPLSWIADKLISGSMRMMDNRVDRKAQAMTR